MKPEYVDREKILIQSNGIWLADGQEISHRPTLELFQKNIKHDSEGYFLHIGREKKRLDVEDTAYFIKGIRRVAGGYVDILVSDQTEERLDPETLEYRPGRLICRISRDGQKEEAKFLRAAYFDFLQDLEETRSEFSYSRRWQNHPPIWKIIWFLVNKERQRNFD